jgi:hypothetical protein
MTSMRAAQPHECMHCFTAGHWVEHCPKALCKHCKVEGHIIKNCPDMKNIKCYNCNMLGHMQERCPNPHSSGKDCTTKVEILKRELQEKDKALNRLRAGKL